VVEAQTWPIDRQGPLGHCPLIGHDSRRRQAPTARLERTLGGMRETAGNRHETIMVTAANVQG
jgi:hypothetical protein